MPGIAIARQNLLYTMLACENIIPFGSPVVPEVYIIVASESGFISGLTSGLLCEASALNSSKLITQSSAAFPFINTTVFK